MQSSEATDITRKHGCWNFAAVGLAAVQDGLNLRGTKIDLMGTVDFLFHGAKDQRRLEVGDGKLWLFSLDKFPQGLFGKFFAYTI